jgi:hypothetical protein
MRRTRVLLWRWRRNPLRRRSDIAEAWVVLLTIVAMAVAGPVVALVAARALDGPFQRIAHQEGHARHRTAAVLLDDPAWQAPWDVDGDSHALARVRWTGPDGTTRRGDAKVGTDRHLGQTTQIWTDVRGRLTSAPLTVAQARLRARLGGVAAGGGTCLLLLTARVAVGRRLDRARMTDWDLALADLAHHPKR